MRICLLVLLTATAACTKQTPAPRPPPKLERTEIITGGAEPDQTLPAIVALHGLGDRPESFARIFEHPALDFPARVIVPRAPHANGHGGFYWFPIRTRDGAIEAKAEALARELAGAAEIVDRLLVELAERDDVKGKPIITGFSQGGMLSFAVAALHPEHVDAAIPIAGWLPAPLVPEKVPKQAPPIRALHGTADPIIPFDLDRDACAKLEALGYDVELLPFEGVGHTVTPQMHRRWAELLSARVARDEAKGAAP